MRGRGHCYRPIDELLTDMPFLILRAVRWFDWAHPDQIVDALDIPGADEDHHQRNSFDVVLSRLTRRGHLERIRVYRMSYAYRITAAGRDEYARRLRRSVA